MPTKKGLLSAIWNVNSIALSGAVTLTAPGLMGLRARTESDQTTIQDREGIDTAKYYHNARQSATFDFVVLEDTLALAHTKASLLLAIAPGSILTVADADDVDAEHIGDWNVDSVELTWASKEACRFTMECSRGAESGHDIVAASD